MSKLTHIQLGLMLAAHVLSLGVFHRMALKKKKKSTNLLLSARAAENYNLSWRVERVIYSSRFLFGVTAKQNTLLQSAALAPNPCILLQHVQGIHRLGRPAINTSTRRQSDKLLIHCCSTGGARRRMVQTLLKAGHLLPLTAPGRSFPPAFKTRRPPRLSFNAGPWFSGKHRCGC